MGKSLLQSSSVERGQGGPTAQESIVFCVCDHTSKNCK